MPERGTMRFETHHWRSYVRLPGQNFAGRAASRTSGCHQARGRGRAAQKPARRHPIPYRGERQVGSHRPRAVYGGYLEPGRKFWREVAGSCRARCRTTATAYFVRSCASVSSGRCEKATTFFRKPSSSGIASGDANGASLRKNHPGVARLDRVGMGGLETHGKRFRSRPLRLTGCESTRRNAIKVEVLNGTRTKGMARRATMYLRERGFDVVGAGTEPRRARLRLSTIGRAPRVGASGRARTQRARGHNRTAHATWT